MLLVDYPSCVPNTDQGVTLRETWLNTRTGGEGDSLVSYSFARKSDAAIGSKTCIGLTYLECGLINVLWLVEVSGVGRQRKHRDGLTRLDTMILVSPPRAAAGAVGAALAGLPCRVDLETPPTGPGAAAGRPAPERRPLRPRREVLRMSSRLCSILFEDMLMSVEC